MMPILLPSWQMLPCFKTNEPRGRCDCLDCVLLRVTIATNEQADAERWRARRRSWLEVLFTVALLGLVIFALYVDQGGW